MKASGYRALTLSVGFLLIIFTAEGQEHSVSGTIFSTASKEIIAQATVKLLDRDSSVIQSTLSDSIGNYFFHDIRNGNYMIYAEALSYAASVRQIMVLRDCYHDSLFLPPSFGDLQAVTVTAKKPLLKIKRDTSEYNTGVFRVTPDGSIEDIFRKIPELEVTDKGTIRAQGEPVVSIYVNGKPFFGNDLNAIKQAFPAEMIAKIQIIDKKNDEAILTGVDDGSYEKIINVVLKKNAKKGIYAKNKIGYGTGGHYDVEGNANLMDDTRNISFIAGNSNGNSSFNTFNSSAGVVTSNKQAKLNYSDRWGNNMDFSLWASYADYSNTLRQGISRQTYAGDSIFTYSGGTSVTNRSKTVSTGLYCVYKPDSFTVIKVNEAFNVADNGATSETGFHTAGTDGSKRSDGFNGVQFTSTLPSLSGQISFNRRLTRGGRNLFISISNVSNRYLSLGYTYATTNVYPEDTALYARMVTQFTKTNNKNTNIGTTISYSEPIRENQSLNLSYTYNSDDNDMPKGVYDLNAQDGSYDIADPVYSFHFINNTNSHTASITYSCRLGNTGFSTGMRWKQSATGSQSFGKDTVYQQQYIGFLPNFSFYTSGRKSTFSLFYNAYIQSPQSFQLQPVIDNSDPMYIRLGNPDLKYAVVNLFRYQYKYYNSKRERGFSSSASYSATKNSIGNKISVDNISGSQVTEPVNTGDAFSCNMRFSYFQPLYLGDSKMRWNVNFTAGLSGITNILNEAEDMSRNTYARLFLGFTYDTPQWIDLHTDISLSRLDSKYSIGDIENNATYYLGLSPTVTLRIPDNLQIKFDYDVSRTAGNLVTENTSLNMLNARVTKYFKRHKNLSVSLEGNNLLNEHTYVSRLYGANYLQDTWTAGASRYLLASVHLNFETFDR